MTTGSRDEVLDVLKGTKFHERKKAKLFIAYNYLKQDKNTLLINNKLVLKGRAGKVAMMELFSKWRN